MRHCNSVISFFSNGLFAKSSASKSLLAIDYVKLPQRSHHSIQITEKGHVKTQLLVAFEQYSTVFWFKVLFPHQVQKALWFRGCFYIPCFLFATIASKQFHLITLHRVKK
jgi:hypothetical protein